MVIVIVSSSFDFHDLLSLLSFIRPRLDTGPPPLDKEKIKEIPIVEVTSDQVDIKLQCSVCWEDFKLGEAVRKLPCTVSILNFIQILDYSLILNFRFFTACLS